MSRRPLLAIVGILCCVSGAFAADSSIKLVALTAEHMVNPIGIGATHPRLSWKLDSNRPGEVQTAYEVRAATSRDKLDQQPDVWNSGKITSDQSVLVPWGGRALASRELVWWQVRVWDRDDKASDWSDPATIEIGLFSSSTEWKGQWITADLPRVDMMEPVLAKAQWINAGSAVNQAAGVRDVVNLPEGAKVLGASIDIAADGLISLYVNGKPTLQGSSSHTAPFHAECGQQFIAGKNVIAIGSAAVRNARGPGGRNAIAAHVAITLDNGQQIELNTDGKWKAAKWNPPAGRGRGGFGAAGAANAPATDQAMTQPADWFATDFDDSSWANATAQAAYAQASPVPSADSTIGPGRYLRKSFSLKGPITRARLYATALGTYEASINGKPVSDEQLAPGWTDYAKRVMVQTYDVTRLLEPGQPNCIGAVLTDGWFAGRVGWAGLHQYSSVGTRPVFAAQLEITYADGSTDVIATDPSWKAGAGEIVGSDQQLGEIVDARKSAGWDQPSFNDSAWASAVAEPHAGISLDPQLGPPVRRLMELAPVKIWKIGDVWMIDLGQNIVGHVQLTAQGPAGTTITVSHAEMLNADGSLYTENLRPAISLDRFILGGSATPERLEPHFTFHGFRYISVAGYPGELTPDKIRGVVIGSDTPPIGAFSCSNADVNQLFSNIRWGQRGNFISVPTDCPQRDERMGWMGDAHVFAPTAAYNADVAGFFAKWLLDVNDAQGANGAFNNVSPRANQNQSYPVWGDAGVIIPWVMYSMYGDRAFLERSYDPMVRWMQYSQQTFPDLLASGGVGDHLAPIATAPAGAGGRGAPGRGGFGGGINTTSVVDTAYFAHSAWIVSHAASVLGKAEDAAKFDRLFHQIADAFNKAYVQPDGTIRAGTQTTYILALQFDLLPENLRAAAAQHLIDDVTQRGHLTTGFVGVGFLNPTLCAIGRPDLAYQLLLTDTYPSWLFTVKQGATTMWERWDGWTPDRGFQASSMNSFNHYSLGAVGKWLYSGVGGIQLDENHPGFKQFILQPQFSTKLDWAKVSYDSPYGTIGSSWSISNGRVSYDATIPPNSSATLTLPAAGDDLQSSGGTVTAHAGGSTTLNLPPGTYHFSFPAPAK